MKPANPQRIVIYYTEPDEMQIAMQLSASLDLPVTADTAGYDFVLSRDNNRLTLSMPRSAALKGGIFTEFTHGATGYRRKQGQREMLLKAVGAHKSKGLTVLDATGGLGRDSFLMAACGCTVHILERNKIVAALLADGLQRAARHEETSGIAERITLSVLDSREFLEKYADTEQYDVIYLDPMYPERSKTALVKKEMQILQQLIGPEDDTEQLLAAALKAARKRVVVKRPKTAPFLTGRKPSHSLTGKTTRFDVYMLG